MWWCSPVAVGGRHRASMSSKQRWTFLFLKMILFLKLCVCLCLCVGMYKGAHLGREARSGCRRPWSQSYRWLWAAWHVAENQAPALCTSSVLLLWLSRLSCSPALDSQGVWDQLVPHEALSQENKTKQKSEETERIKQGPIYLLSFVPTAV